MPDSTARPPEAMTQRQLFAGKLLIYGVAVTAMITTPGQLVFPDTIKSVAASAIAIISLLILSWEFYKTSSFRWSAFLLVPLGLIVVALCSVFWSMKYPALVEAGRWTIIFLIILTGLNTLQKSAFQEIATTIHWCSFLLSLLALCQFWFDLSWFPTAAAPGSTFGNRNFFAEFVAASMPFSFWILLRKQSFISALWRGLSLGIIFVALMSTGARAALIATLVGIAGMAALILVSRHRSKIFSTGSALAISISLPIFIVFLLGWIPSLNDSVLDEKRGHTPIERTLHRLGSLSQDDTYENGSSFGIRIVAWRASLKMIQEHPFKGVGAGAWNANLPVYMPPAYDSDIEYVWHAHNEPLQLIAEFGVMAWVALIAFLTLLIRAMHQSLSKMRKSESVDIEEGPYEGLIILSIILMGITSLSGLPLHAPSTNYLLALCIAMLLVFHPDILYSKKSENASLKRVNFLPITLSVAFLIVALITSLQALRADYFFLKGYNILAALAKHPNPERTQANQLRRDALNHLKTALAIYPDQGNFTGHVANHLGELGDHESMIWISDLMLELRPNTATLRCNKVIAFVEMQNFSAAKEEIEKIQRLRPQSSCLDFSNFITAYKTGDYSKTLSTGLKILENIDKNKKDEKLRFTIESTYRSAIRISDTPAAIRMLRMRGDLWPDLKPHSRLLEGLLRANSAPNQISPEATAAFQEALSLARAIDRPEIKDKIPKPYQESLK